MSQEELNGLNQVADLARRDFKLYEQYVPSLLKICERPELKLKLWIANYLLDALGSKLRAETRRSLAIQCLDAILNLLTVDTQKGVEERHVAKATILLAAAAFPLGFADVCYNDQKADVWDKLTRIKDLVAKLWDLNSGNCSVELACVKFAQQLVLVQSRGASDPRLAMREGYVVSLGDVKAGHKLLHRSLEAEGQGVLDRLLSGLSEQKDVKEPVFTATVFALAPLMKQRPDYANKILQTVLSVDPSHNRDAFKTRLALRFCEKSLRMLVTHSLRNKIAMPLKPRLERYLAELGKTPKRPAEEAQFTPTQQPATVKKQRLESQQPQHSVTMPPGADSYSALFTLISPHDPLVAFDARTLPQELATKIAMTGLLTADEATLRNAVSVIKQRYDNFLNSLKPKEANGKPATSRESQQSAAKQEDDMDVDNRESEEPDVSEEEDDEVEDFSGEAFELPPPEALTLQDKADAGSQIVDRFLSHRNVAVAAKPSEIKTNAISKLAVNEWASNSWMVFLSRLLTRGLAYDPRDEPEDSYRRQLATHIRTTLLTMATTAFTSNFDDIMTWLNEEWYSELLRDGAVDPDNSFYYEYAGRIMDTLVQTVDPDNWKYFIRLVGELPEMDAKLVSKLKHLLIDPDRSVIGVRSLKYLIMLRPPTREFCLDVIEEVYGSNESMRPSFKAVLQKHRPSVLAIEPAA